MMTIRVNSSKKLTEFLRLHILFSVNSLQFSRGLKLGFLSENVTVIRLFPHNAECNSNNNNHLND